MRIAVCDHKRCRREAVAAFDVRPSSGFRDEDIRHYEVCEKHSELFHDGGWLRSEWCEKIKRELVPS